jgi:hypothetical protein
VKCAGSPNFDEGETRFQMFLQTLFSVLKSMALPQKDVDTLRQIFG